MVQIERDYGGGNVQLAYRYGYSGDGVRVCKQVLPMARRYRLIIGLLAVCLCLIGAMTVLPLGVSAVYVGAYQSDIDKHPDLVRVYWKSPDIEPILSRQPKIDKWVVIGGGGTLHPRTASRIGFWSGGGIQFVCWYHEETPVRYLWLQQANGSHKKFTPPPPS